MLRNDGIKFCFFNQDKAVLIVDVTSGAVRARLLGHTSEVNALAWSQCQEGLLASCSDDGIKVGLFVFASH